MKTTFIVESARAEDRHEWSNKGLQSTRRGKKERRRDGTPKHAMASWGGRHFKESRAVSWEASTWGKRGMLLF
jgi:hypothetical protein